MERGKMAFVAATVAALAMTTDLAVAQSCTAVMGQTCGVPVCNNTTMGAGTQVACVRTAVLGENLSSVTRFHHNSADCSNVTNRPNDTVMFYGMAMIGVTNAACSWNIYQQDSEFNCSCSLTNPDGLPVELLEFAVDD